MHNLNELYVPDIDDIDNMRLVGPIEFFSDEQNEQILADLKQRLKSEKHMKWYTLDEASKKIKEQFGF